MNKTTSIRVADYSQNYGGVPVIVDGRTARICSIVGYALYNREDPVAAVLDCVDKMKRFPYHGHELVWITLCSTALCADPGYYEQEEARRATMPNLSVGDNIVFEGNTYRIGAAPNNNFSLEKI